MEKRVHQNQRNNNINYPHFGIYIITIEMFDDDVEDVTVICLCYNFKYGL